MSEPSRREFVRSAGLAAAALAAGEALANDGESHPGQPDHAGRPQQNAAGERKAAVPAAPAAQSQPAALAHGKPGEPMVVGSANAVPACNRAIELLRQGKDPVEAVVAGVNIVESDPNDHSVGYGGLPNEDGVVELDASVMHGPTHKAGAVAALQKIKNPSSVARLVMKYTDHVLLVGEGALRFAKAMGFKEEELLTDEARKMWLKWKATHPQQSDWLYPEGSDGASRLRKDGGPQIATEATARRLRADGIDFTYGTINCLALTPQGDLGGCTSTSGLSWKLSGRVGDSPIIGAGLFVDNAVGGAGSTGRGEANLQNCACFLIVELMRGGMEPTPACLEALRRVAQHTEKRLRNARGEPDFGLSFYALRKDGQIGGATLHRSAENVPKMAVHDGGECRLIDLPALYHDA